MVWSETSGHVTSTAEMLMASMMALKWVGDIDQNVVFNVCYRSLLNDLLIDI